MGLKSDKLSDNGCQNGAAYQLICNCAAFLSSFKSKAGADKPYESREITNHLSASFSHDSSGNEEIKANLGVNDIFEGIAMLSEVATAQADADAEAEPFFEQKDFFSRRLCSIKRKRNDSECNDDNMSCISHPDSPNMMADCNNSGIFRKNVSCCAVSVNSLLLEEDTRTTNVQPIPECANRGHEVKEGHMCSSRQSKLFKKSLQKNALFSGKSDASVISVPIYARAYNRSVKRQHSKTFMDQTKSSSMILLPAIVKGHGHNALNDAESVKIELEENLSGNLSKCSNQNEDLAKCQVANEGKFLLEHKPLDCSNGPDLLIDVKVCDICGDAGREDLLAICSKCSDGAEHTYCMRIKMDKIPEHDWMCEECLLLEEDQEQNKCEMIVQGMKKSSLDELHQYGGTLSCDGSKTCFGLDIRPSYASGSRENRSSSVSTLFPKIPVSKLDLTSNLMTKRCMSETSVETPKVDSPCAESQLSQKSSLKANSHMHLSNDNSFKNVPQKDCLPSNSGCNLPKFQQSLPTPPGNLIKSKSFNISDTKLKVQLQEDNLPKKNSYRNIAFSDNKTNEPIRMIRKSLSLNNIRPKYLNVADQKLKMLSSKFSCKGMKKLRHSEEHSLVQRKYPSKFEKSSGSSPIAASRVSAPQHSKNIKAHGECTLPFSSVTKHLDVKPVQQYRKSHNSLKHVHAFCNERSKNFGLAKRLPLSSSDVVHDPSSSMVAPASFEVKLDGERSYHYPTALSGCGASSDAVLQDIMLLSQESSNNGEKEQESSYVDRNKQVVYDPKSCYQLDVATLQANPLPNYIWKGAFEVQNNQKLPRFCHGIQAHLSYLASFKVPEVVKKFPSRLRLEETPRLEVWPIQFLENHPMEENVALYFYTKDSESYGKYKNFLECMNNYDLALRGNFDGVELLIFSSDILLPRNSKRWNGLFFLWGVFKVRMVDGTQSMPSLPKSTYGLPLTSVFTCEEACMPTVPGLDSTFYLGPPREHSTESILNCNVQQIQSFNFVDPRGFPIVSLGSRDENCQSKASCPDQSYQSLQINIYRKQGRDDQESNLPWSTSVQEKQFYKDMQQKKVVFDEKWQEGCLPHLKDNKDDDDDDAEVIGYLTEATTPSSSSRCLSGGTFGFAVSEQQQHFSDHENKTKSEPLDLELSLGAGREQLAMHAYLGIANAKNEKGRIPNALARLAKNCDYVDESWEPLELSLALPSAPLNLSLALPSCEK